VTLRVIGPACDSAPNGLAGHTGTRPCVGFRTDDPAEAGRHADRPAAVGADRPRAHPERDGRRAAAAGPAGVRAGFHGFSVAPYRIESVTPFQPNSGVVVLPSRPRRSPGAGPPPGASSGQSPSSSISVLPRSVGQPRV
jgi:hypothetical protein